MKPYDILFFDHANHVYSSERVECHDDAHAIAVAHDLNAPCIGAGFEIWQDERLVHRARSRVPMQA